MIEAKGTEQAHVVGLLTCLNGLSIELAAHMFMDTVIAQTHSLGSGSPEIKASSLQFQKFAVGHFESVKDQTRISTLKGSGKHEAADLAASTELVSNYFEAKTAFVNGCIADGKRVDEGQLMIDLKEVLVGHFQTKYFTEKPNAGYRNMTWDNWAVVLAAEAIVLIEMSRIEPNWKYSELWLKDSVSTRAAAFPVAVDFIHTIIKHGGDKPDLRN
jgi:hypothetical protein